MGGVQKCCVLSCKINQQNKNGRTFFHFPNPSKSEENRKLCTKWIQNINNTCTTLRNSGIINSYYKSRVVCEDHFTEDSFCGFYDSPVARSLNFKPNRRHLRKDAIPTIFHVSPRKTRSGTKLIFNDKTKTISLFDNEKAGVCKEQNVLKSLPLDAFEKNDAANDKTCGNKCINEPVIKLQPAFKDTIADLSQESCRENEGPFSSISGISNSSLHATVKVEQTNNDQELAHTPDYTNIKIKQEPIDGIQVPEPVMDNQNIEALIKPEVVDSNSSLNSEIGTEHDYKITLNEDYTSSSENCAQLAQRPTENGYLVSLIDNQIYPVVPVFLNKNMAVNAQTQENEHGSMYLDRGSATNADLCEAVNNTNNSCGACDTRQGVEIPKIIEHGKTMTETAREGLNEDDEAMGSTLALKLDQEGSSCTASQEGALKESATEAYVRSNHKILTNVGCYINIEANKHNIGASNFGIVGGSMESTHFNTIDTDTKEDVLLFEEPENRARFVQLDEYFTTCDDDWRGRGDHIYCKYWPVYRQRVRHKKVCKEKNQNKVTNKTQENASSEVDNNAKQTSDHDNEIDALECSDDINVKQSKTKKRKGRKGELNENESSLVVKPKRRKVIEEPQAPEPPRLIKIEEEKNGEEICRKSSRIKSVGYRPDYRAIEQKIDDILSESDDDYNELNEDNCDVEDTMEGVEVIKPSTENCDDGDAFKPSEIEIEKTSTESGADKKEEHVVKKDPNFEPGDFKSGHEADSSESEFSDILNSDGEECEDIDSILSKMEKTIKPEENLASIKLENHLDKFRKETAVSLCRKDRAKPVDERSVELFACNICTDFKCESKERMELHLTDHINGKLKCRKCKLQATSIKQLQIHLRVEHPKKRRKFSCSDCDFTALTEKALKNHSGNIHKKALFECAYCKKAEYFLTYRSLKKHIVAEHKESLLKCPRCCCEYFRSKLHLKMHLRSCQGEDKSADCKLCGKTYPSKAMLNAHFDYKHYKVKEFQCPLCPYSARRKRQLARHMPCHSGEHEIRCDKCAFSCIQLNQLHSHMRTHTGDKPYKCDQCNYAAAWNVLLKEHKNAHSSDTAVTCDLCEIVFKSEKSLKLHHKKEHKNV